MDDLMAAVSEKMLHHGVSRPELPSLDDKTVAALARNIETDGFAVIPGYVGAGLLGDLRRMVMGLVQDSGGEYRVLSGVGEMTGTLLEAIGSTPEFVSLMRRLYECDSGKAAPQQSGYQVLRCIAGESGRPHAYFFHYDSYVVTALLPIVIPAEGGKGDLVMKPNLRKLRSSYLANVIDKILIDNRFSQRLLRRFAIAQRFGFIKVEIVPGNLYLFWGYRSVHANEACDVDKVRATALFHFGDPHANSKLRTYLGNADARATVGPVQAA